MDNTNLSWVNKKCPSIKQECDVKVAKVLKDIGEQVNFDEVLVPVRSVIMVW